MYELRAKPDSTEMDSLNVNETGEALLWMLGCSWGPERYHTAAS